MAIVARAGRRVLALALAASIAACSPAPSTSPAASPGPTAAAAATQQAACRDTSASPPATQPAWANRVFYEAFVRSFKDSNGDGVGDLAGLTSKLDYLNDGDPATSTDLGVTGLWLMPVAKAASYHGYDVTDYTKVEPDYGDATAMQALVKAAHERGIEVIVDFVINHTSSQHPWFKEALANGPHRDWYIWSDVDPGWPNPIGAGDPWRPSKSGFYYALFWEGMPDLNFRNPAVTAEIERVAAFWLDTMGVDGFRIDAARHLIEDGPTDQVNTPETHAWLAGFRTKVHADKPDSLVVGEVDDAERTSGGYVTDGSLDMTFDFEVGPAIANAVAHGDAGSLLYAEGSIQKAYPNGGAGTFLSNHDQPRIMTQLRGDASAAATSAATLLTAPGTPFIYYGEELGMAGDKPDERIRTPFPWSPDGPAFGFSTGTPWEAPNDGAAAANVERESADPASMLSTYRDLIRLRAAHPGLATSPVVALDSSVPHVAATLRSGSGERLLVLQNLAADPASGVALRAPASSLCGPVSARIVYPAASGESVAQPTVAGDGSLDGYVPLQTLPGRSTTVISLNP